MCKVNVTTKIYSCGDTVKDQTNFERCKDAGTEKCPGVTENTLGSSRKGGKCGRFDCRNP
jgi:hypothetical protein